MLEHLQDWLALAIRWAHLVTGIAWIGASFYFNWLENRLQRHNQPDGYAGDLWAVHGGGFYYLRKLSVAPGALPAELHWFKWEAYTTWLTGFALLCAIYYWDAAAFLVRPENPGISSALAIAIGLAALAFSWLLYDGLCRLLANSSQALLALMVLAWFTLLAWLLDAWLSDRAAYIHTGAAIGTVMVANVFRVIIPAQRDLVDAVAENRPPDSARAANALLRSRHNNYLTLPVLFIMISAHFPSTYAHSQAWLVLLGISVSGVLLRHYFNVRHLGGPAGAYGAAGLVVLALTALLSAPRPPEVVSSQVDIPLSTVTGIVQERCASCHSRSPTQPGYVAPPLGIVLDTPEDLLRQRKQVYQSVASRTMPLANLTAMTAAERKTIVNWHHSDN